VLDANFVDMNNEDAVCKALSCFRIQGFQRTSFVAPHVDKTNFRLRRGSSSRTWGLGMPVNEADILWVELRPNLSRYPRPALDRPRPRRMLFLHQRLLVCYWPCSDEAGAGRTACGTARTPFTRSDIGTRLRSAILIKIIVMRALLSPTSLPSSRPSSPPTATKPPPASAKWSPFSAIGSTQDGKIGPPTGATVVPGSIRKKEKTYRKVG